MIEIAEWIRRTPFLPAWAVCLVIALAMGSFVLRWWWWARPMPPPRRAQYLACGLSMAPLLFFYGVVWAAEANGLADLVTLYRPLSRWAIISLCVGQIANSSSLRVLVGDLRQWIGHKL